LDDEKRERERRRGSTRTEGKVMMMEGTAGRGG
jgi:hypothetical protein